MGLGVFDHTVGQRDVAISAGLPHLPRLLTLTARRRTLLRSVLVTESTATSGQNDVGMTEVLEESRQTQSIHATRDDRSCLLHALPILVVVWAIRLVLLQHERDVLIRGVSLHLAEGHGADMDAAGADDAGDLGVDEGRVATLRLRAGDGTVARTVVVQELAGEVAARDGHGGATSDVAVNEEGAILSQGAELRKHVLGTGDHLFRVVGSDVGREQLGGARLLDAGAHRFHHLGDAFVHLAEDLVALRLVVLDEVTSLPESVARLTERLGLETQLGFDDRAHNEATIARATAKVAPHVDDAARRSIEQPQEARREVEIVDLAVVHVAHTLVVANGQGQERAHHAPAVGDVAVEQKGGVRDLALFLLRINVVNQRVDALGEIVGRADVHVGAGGRLRREVRRGGEVVVARLRLHDVGDEDVLAVLDQGIFVQRQVRIAARLIERRPRHSAALLRCRQRCAREGGGCGLLFPIERGSLH
mmetsp:Transcript_39195/g.99544  ORF Transcript_39195/g.99544 Transcript_39195/m.99544 type:complete len:477 (+) Transcript_39195:555-1985(+)